MPFIPSVRPALSAFALFLAGVAFAAPVVVSAAAQDAGRDRFRILATPTGEVEVFGPDGAHERFGPEFTVLRTADNPNLEMRWGKFVQTELHLSDTGSVYNVLTWGPKSLATATALHVEDGFDPHTDRGYGPGRTADMFAAGRNERLSATSTSTREGKVVWDFSPTEAVQLQAEVEVPADGGAPRLRFKATARRDGWYSFGYTGGPSVARAGIDELWQPLIWNERRFPEATFLEAAYRCPLPTTLVTRRGTTVGVVADASEYPFQPMPNLLNSRFGVGLRNAQGEAQPMLFAPILGGTGSQMKAGETREFVVRLFVAKSSLSAAYERIARSLFNFADQRHNALGSLNATFENMLEFGRGEYARFNHDLRGFAYDTDVPGAVKNVSALHPLGVALVTDDREIFTELARPLLEFFVSRDRFLFTTDPKVKGQSASARLGGLGAPLTEYATLFAMSGGRIPFFRQAAESLFGQDRVLNLEGKIRGDNWSNALALYRATGERRWLEHAVRDADRYLKTRVAFRQADYSDPDSRGLFFWTAFVPQWIELFELYEETGEPRFLEAAHEGARGYAQFVWLAPRVPEGNVVVNEGGLAPAYRSGPRFPRIRIAEETVPAWRVSEIGLTSESAPTSKGARGILLACYAPWMLRISALTGDRFLHDIARSAVIGRYTSFPGYHLNTARTTVYEKPDFARRSKEELNSTTSIHYNHIWPHIALVLDYLVADVFAKSRGQVSFPSRYAEGYGYLQQKIYGDRPGRMYDTADLHVWLPRGLARVSHPQLNYVGARGTEVVAIALTNQSRERVSSKVTFDAARVHGLPGARVRVWQQNANVGELRLDADGAAEIEVAPEGITVLVVRGVQPQPAFQHEFAAGRPTRPGPAGDAVEIDFHGAKAVALRFGPGALTSAYVYLPDFDRTVARCTLRYRQGTVDYSTLTDTAFPFDFTVPAGTDEDIEWYLEIERITGKREKSALGRIRL